MTKRADPTTSVESARRHFFRHFHDLKELQRNPLAAPFFAAARAARRPAPEHAAFLDIHRAIERILSDYETSTAWRPANHPLRRRLKLFKAYVVERRDPEELMRELCLSERQFFRDYGIIRDKVLDALRPRRSNASSTQWLDSEEIVLAQAVMLAEAGLPIDAESCLRRAIAETATGEGRAKLLCELTRIQTEQAQYHDAAISLREAINSSTDVRNRFETGYLAQALSWKTYDPAVDVPGVDAVSDFGSRVVRGALARPVMDSFLSQAEHLGFLARYREQLDMLERARLALDPDWTDVRQRVQYACAYATAIYCTSPEFSQEAVERIEEAAAVAQRHRYLRSHIIAVSTVIPTHFVRNDYDSMRDAIDRCHRAIAKMDDRAAAIEVYLQTPDDERDREGVINALRQVQALLPGGDYRLPMLHLLLAAAAVRLDDKHAAMQYSEDAIREASKQNNLRVRGAAQRQLAVLQHEQRDTAQAKRNIREAIELIEDHGSVFSRRQAHAAYAQIVGSRYRHYRA